MTVEDDQVAREIQWLRLIAMHSKNQLMYLGVRNSNRRKLLTFSAGFLALTSASAIAAVITKTLGESGAQYLAAVVAAISGFISLVVATFYRDEDIAGMREGASKFIELNEEAVQLEVSEELSQRELRKRLQALRTKFSKLEIEYSRFLPAGHFSDRGHFGEFRPIKESTSRLAIPSDEVAVSSRDLKEAMADDSLQAEMTSTSQEELNVEQASSGQRKKIGFPDGYQTSWRYFYDPKARPKKVGRVRKRFPRLAGRASKVLIALASGTAGTLALYFLFLGWQWAVYVFTLITEPDDGGLWPFTDSGFVIISPPSLTPGPGLWSTLFISWSLLTGVVYLAGVLKFFSRLRGVAAEVNKSGKELSEFDSRQV